MPAVGLTRPPHVDRGRPAGRDNTGRGADAEQRGCRRRFAAPFDDRRAALRERSREPAGPWNLACIDFCPPRLDATRTARVVHRDRAVPFDRPAGNVQNERVQR